MIGTLFPVIAADIFPDVICHSKEHPGDQMFRLNVLEWVTSYLGINTGQMHGNIYHNTRRTTSTSFCNTGTGKKMYSKNTPR